MKQDSLEVALIKYNKKTWCKSALLGFFIGLAVIVPGISGSTVAIIFKLYDQFLYALGNLFKQFKKCFIFLLPIGIGIVLGVALGFFAVDKLLELLPFAIVCLFAGLMSGAFPAVTDEIKGAKRTPWRIVLFALGVAVPLALGCVSALLTINTPAGEVVEGVTKTIFDHVQWWHIALGFVFGAVVGITQIVPGMSASAFLMAVGWFQSVVSSVSLTYWKQNPAVWLVYVALGIGFCVGVFGFSGVLTKLFAKAHDASYFAIVGLSLGSILSIFCNGDIVEVYLSWVTGQVGATMLAVNITLGILLFTFGIIGAYALVRYQRKKDAEGKETETAEEV